MVRSEALDTCALNEDLALARIDAAAAEGDVISAASVLDQLNHANRSVHIGHMTAAIRGSDNAARLLYRSLLDMGLQPNVVTFTCLATKNHLLTSCCKFTRRCANSESRLTKCSQRVLRKPRAAGTSTKLYKPSAACRTARGRSSSTRGFPKVASSALNAE